MKLKKAILMILVENTFCIMFILMLLDTLFGKMNWGLFTLIIIGMFFVVSFSMCIAGLADLSTKQKGNGTSMTLNEEIEILNREYDSLPDEEKRRIEEQKEIARTNN